MKDDFKPSQPIMFSSYKLKLLPRRLKIKWAILWVIKEIRTDGTIELQNPYSK